MVCVLLGAGSRGLLGAHVMADMLRQRGDRMQWYQDELLHMAKELGHRLLPAFNTTSGLPYPRVTHRHSRSEEGLSRIVLRRQRLPPIFKYT